MVVAALLRRQDRIVINRVFTILRHIPVIIY